MSNAINIILLVILLYLAIQSNDEIRMVRFLTFYLICCVIAPTMYVSSMTISFEILSFPIFFLRGISTDSMDDACVIDRSYITTLWTCFAVMILSTIVGILIFNNNLALMEGIGTARYIIELAIAVRLARKIPRTAVTKIIINTIICISFVNLIFSIVQLVYPSSLSFFYNLYHTNAQTYWYSSLERGSLKRAIGAMANAPYLGGFSLMALSILFYFLKTEFDSITRRKVLLGILFVTLSGLLSLSKTFIVGFFILIILHFIIGSSSGWVKGVLVGALAIILFYYAATILVEFGGFSASKYLSYLNDPLSALNSRYSEDAVLMSNTMSAIKENPIIGYGFSTIAGAFRGDSSYVNTLYRCGIIGFIIYFVGFFKMNYSFRGARDKYLIIIYAGMLLVYVGLNWIYRFESIIAILVLIPCFEFEQNGNLQGAN